MEDLINEQVKSNVIEYDINEQVKSSGIKVDPAVHHPKHYTSHPSGVECIDITRHMNFNLGNVVKYVWRAGFKNESLSIQDLEKAAWYLNDEIERRRREE